MTFLCTCPPRRGLKQKRDVSGDGGGFAYPCLIADQLSRFDLLAKEPNVRQHGTDGREQWK